MSTAVPLTPNFRRTADMVDQGLLLRPLVERALALKKWGKRFDVTFYAEDDVREPDDWFHPSTHPLWTPRQLYYYLTEPDRIVPELLSYESRMAITMGIAMHGFIEMVIRNMGVMVPLEGDCVACGLPHGIKRGQCNEYGAADLLLKRRGHQDGELIIEKDGTHWKAGRGNFEFKTTNDNAARSLVENDIESFRKKWPVYFGQVQEYMDLTGYNQSIVLIGVIGYPWKLLEFQIPYDVTFATQVRDKYALVRDHVKMGFPPDACCAALSTQARACVVRDACPVGRIRR